MPRWADELMVRIALPALQRKAMSQAPMQGSSGNTPYFSGPSDSTVVSARTYQTMVQHGFKGNSYVYRATMLIGTSIARIPWVLYEKRGKDRVEVESHPILRLLNTQSNARETALTTTLRSHAYRLLAGDAFWLVIRANDGTPLEWYCVRPDRIKPDVSRATDEITQWIYEAVPGKKQPYPLTDVRHLMEFNPDDDGTGFAPTKAAGLAIDLHNEINKHNLALNRNQARPSGMAAPALTTGEDAVLTPTQRETLEADINRKFSGAANAGRVFVPQAPMKWTAMGLTPVDMDFMHGKVSAEREIALVEAVPPELLYDHENATFNNFEQAWRGFYTDTVIPRKDFDKAEYNSWLVPMFNLDPDRYELDYDQDKIPALQEDRTVVWNRAQTATFLTINEQRDMLGYEAIEGGDVVLVQSTLVPLDQALEPPPPPQPTVHVTPLPDGTQPQLPPGNDNGGQPASPPAGGAADTPPPAKSRRMANKAISLATEEQKAAHWKKTETSREAWYGTIGDEVAKQFTAEHKAVVAAIKGAGSAAKATKAAQAAIDDGTWKDLIAAIHIGVGEPFAKQAVDDVNGEAKARNVPQRKAADVADGWTKYVTKWLKTEGAAKVTQITDTTRQKIQNHLADGVANEETIDQLAARIDSLYLDSLIPNRSQVIARTETIAASNSGSLFGAKSTGLPLQKEWIATRDSRTREDHADADGQLVDLDAKFSVGGDEMDAPGSGSDPGENINCRCTLGYHVNE